MGKKNNEAAAQLASKRNKDGWLITWIMPSYIHL